MEADGTVYRYLMNSIINRFSDPLCSALPINRLYIDAEKTHDASRQTGVGRELLLFQIEVLMIKQYRCGFRVIVQLICSRLH